MQQDFQLLWRRARALENDGQVAAAKGIYESLIAEDPERLYVRIRLGAIAQGEGDYRASRAHAVRSADTVRASRLKDLAVVTRRLLTFDERELVRDLILGIDWHDPEVLKASAVLTQHLWLVGEVEAALRLADTALQYVRPNSALCYSRANALRYLGRMEEATREYERCLSLDPNDAYAHWSLASHEKSRPPGTRVDRVRTAQAAHAPDAVDQQYLHYALFQELDDVGDVDGAWQHLLAGAALKRKAIRYEPDLEAQAFSLLREMPGVADAIVDGGSASTGEARVPIFVVGMPRSGTTLLERILGGHSQVAAAGELNDFNSALSLASNQFFPHFLLPMLVQRLQAIDHAQVGRCYLERTAAWTSGKRFVVDKNPANFTNAGFIARALPQARILCLRRNPMDACMSNLKVLFSNDAFGYSYDLAELADYYLRFDYLSAHWRETLGGQYMEVGYEDLVADPRGMAERVMAFCGLPFEEGSVDITRNTAPVTTASSSQVRQPINTRGIGAWRKYARHLEPLRARLEAGLGPLE